jgi:hypothetical protein
MDYRTALQEQEKAGRVWRRDRDEQEEAAAKPDQVELQRSLSQTQLWTETLCLL